MPTTQMALPSLDDVRAKLANAAPAPEAPTPTKTKPSTEPTPAKGFRRGTQAAAQSEPRTGAARVLVNKYEADCTECGQRVLVGEGIVSKPSGRWVTKHYPECPAQVEVPEGEVREQAPTMDPRNPAPGIYTVEDADGHVTLWVWQQGMDEDFKPGELIVKFFIGRDNTDHHDYKQFGTISGGRLNVWFKHRAAEGEAERRYVRAARSLLANPEAALVAMECPRCHDLLSNPNSIADRIGPKCKVAWGW